MGEFEVATGEVDLNGQLPLDLQPQAKTGYRNRLCKPPPLRRCSEATEDSAPWQPMQAYRIRCSGSLDALNRAVTKMGGVIYCGASGVIVAIPSDGGLDLLGVMLKAEGGGQILSGTAALGPP